MQTYRLPAYRPALRQITPLVEPTIAPTNTAESLFWTALSAAASYAAIRTGIRESGFARIAGWAGGIAAGLAALVGLTGVVAPTAARTLPVRWYWGA